MTFTSRNLVRFAHVDAAGIVFYPRYFEMLNGVVEDYFSNEIGIDFGTMHLERGIGVPTVKLEAEFVAPSRLGDALDWQLDVERVGQSSADLIIEACCAGQSRLIVRVRIVCIDLRTGSSQPWPLELRPREPASVI